ncbi:maleylpyruvate isomerase family mycothiol-dependent enzyme [soil metagenome]
MTDLVVDRGRVFEALEETAPRLTALLTSVGDHRPLAVGEWSIGDVACHLKGLFELYVGMVQGEGPPVARSRDVGAFFDRYLIEHPERDPAVFAEPIEEAARRFLTLARRRPDDEPVPWYDGAKLEVSSLASVLLGEALLHGYDIAKGAGAPWRIPPHEARVLFEGLTPVLPFYVDERAAAGLTATIEIQLRGGPRAHLMFEDGSLVVDGPKQRRVHLFVSAEPVTLLLVAYGRVSAVAGLRRGRLLAWGRRPWLALSLPKLLRAP